MTPAPEWVERASRRLWLAFRRGELTFDEARTMCRIIGAL